MVCIPGSRRYTSSVLGIVATTSERLFAWHVDVVVTFVTYFCVFYSKIFNKWIRFLDYTTGFGGKFGVQTDRVDKSAVGWEHVEKVEKHESQKGKNMKNKLDRFRMSKTYLVFPKVARLFILENLKHS